MPTSLYLTAHNRPPNRLDYLIDLVFAASDAKAYQTAVDRTFSKILKIWEPVYTSHF